MNQNRSFEHENDEHWMTDPKLVEARRYLVNCHTPQPEIGHVLPQASLRMVVALMLEYLEQLDMSQPAEITEAAT